MPAQRHVFTSESVTEGHPDKIADQISDAVLDAIIGKDPAARVACETLVTTGMAVGGGGGRPPPPPSRPHHTSGEHKAELQSQSKLVCRVLLPHPPPPPHTPRGGA